MFATVHGVSRNAEEHARAFAPVCEQLNMVLIAPIFTRERHRDYQRLGRGKRRARGDLLFNRCLSEVASLVSADTSRICLFGYSGGAQFAHRYLMAHPHRISRAVIAAAGWYTFPDDRQRFPYGIGPTPSLDGVRFEPEGFLKIPVHVLVGARDVGLVNVRSTARLNEQQGRNRVERAGNWVAAMRAAAEAYGAESAVTLTKVPGVNHSFTRFCKRGALVERVCWSLFGVDVQSLGKSRENGQFNGTVPGKPQVVLQTA